ncbi:MAG TPA: LptA/OstA family protein [Alphaproteobacteria bacterium]|nr:LptA/OstA family protein [Alphaproteobacteria bacterium]
MIQRAFLLAACAALVAFAGPAAPQGLSLGGGAGDQPIEILARDGIEWHRETQRYIARGDARAQQGATVVEADTLTAFYREKNGEGSEIFRYEADGNVRISTPTQKVVGDKAVFDIDSGVLVMTGRSMKLTTPNETVTARDSLEYWEQKKLAVARGDALVVSADKRMKGEVLAAYFVDARISPPPVQVRAPGQRASRPAPADDGGERNRLQRIEGFGNVHVSTPTDVARGDRGVYNADTGIATLAGTVRITRGDNQLNGDYAEVDLNTGISRLLSRPQAGGDGRVRGLFVPEQRSGDGKGKRTPQ